MTQLQKSLRRLVACESGATAVEYAAVIALIAIVVIASVAALGTKVSATFVDAEQSW